MRKALGPLALIALLAGIASADPYDLENGVVIAHAPPGLEYSSDLDVCAFYFEQAAIDGCAQQVNRIDTSDAPMAWYVLLAWLEPKQWCGFEFGLGDFVAGPAGYLITAHGLCDAPGGGTTLSIPTDDWPGPNEGIAMASTEQHEGLAWSGNFVPMYWFAGYAYAAQVIPLGPNPPTGRVAVLRLPEPGERLEVDFCLESPGVLGAMGMLTDGIPACPPANVGACCLGWSECRVATAECCAALGGTFRGAGTECDPNPCPVLGACCPFCCDVCIMVTQDSCAAYGVPWHEGEVCAEVGGSFHCLGPGPNWACCVGGECLDISADDCHELGGSSHYGEHCFFEDFDCAEMLACCINQYCFMMTAQECVAASGSAHEGETCQTLSCRLQRACCLAEECQITTEDDCCASSGVWHADRESCDPENPCLPHPARPLDWGAVKTLYR